MIINDIKVVDVKINHLFSNINIFNSFCYTSNNKSPYVGTGQKL
jgi:hypothetical protein